MPLHPPTAESILRQEEQDAYQEAGRDAQIIVQRKSPIVEQQGAHHALRNVARKTHVTIGNNAAQEGLHIRAIVSHQDCRNQQEHEGKLI